MANAIEVRPSHLQPVPSSAPSAPEVEGPTCKLVSPETKDRCGKPADRAIIWGGEDDSKTPACADCAGYYVQLSHEHRCPGHVKVVPLDTTRLH